MRAWCCLVCIALVTGGIGTGAWGEDRPPDLAIQAIGTEANGQPLTMTCDLTFAAIPSNTFTGRCRIAVGSDPLLLVGLFRDGVRVLAVFLNSSVTVQGVATEGAGRFAPLVSRGAAGFPMLVRIDPLARTWAITSEVPGGKPQTVAQGVLGKSAITFIVPEGR